MVTLQPLSLSFQRFLLLTAYLKKKQKKNNDFTKLKVKSLFVDMKQNVHSLLQL